MARFILRRLLGMIPTLFVISIITFTLIQLPPGDFLTSQLQQLQQQGERISEDRIAALRARYGLDKPVHVQYVKWMTNFVQGDMGYSFEWNRPVNELIWDRLGYTVLVTFAAMLFTWAVAFPIGIYSALRQYSVGDYVFTTLGFLGLSTPSFLLAMVLMYLGYSWFGVSVGGLFSPEYVAAPWSWAKLGDLLRHVWIPMVVVGMAGTAGLIRVMRANLLDELQKPYVITARAKGVGPIKLILKYPVRIALNPFVSTVGWMLPRLFSGSAIAAVVLSLPTTGPLLLRALMSQDMYLAGSFIMLLSALTVIGTLLSDILLALIDPRIRYE
jgi:peptide/nickel transport system permease protein